MILSCTGTSARFMHLESAAVSEESAVDDFAVAVMRLLNYDADGRRMFRLRKEMGFLMEGKHVGAMADVALLDRQLYTLLVQEDKKATNNEEPEAQLVAEAVAAFNHNNRVRSAFGLRALEREVIPGITMTGTAPTFYRVVVTQDLLDALAESRYPSEETFVFKYLPPVPDPSRYRQTGMLALENRQVVLQYFTAFRKFIGQ